MARLREGCVTCTTSIVQFARLTPSWYFITAGRGYPTPVCRLSFRWCVALPLELLFLDWLCTGRTHTATLQHVTIGRSTYAVGLGPGGTPSRGCRRRNRRRKPSCTSRRRWVEDAGIAGRSRRSRCRRCSLRTRCRGRRRRIGSRRCRDAPVGAPPEEPSEENAIEVTHEKSLDAAVA